MPNKIIKQEEVITILSSPYDENAVLRHPLVVLECNSTGDIMKIFIDRYTTPTEVDLTYCRIPFSFNVLNYDDNDTNDGAVHSYCELPYSCFEDLVNGALVLYMTYKTGLNQPKKQTSKEKEADK
uniref:Uncharacterized protein n=1 Tax=Dulem virus 42 TaxID=3145760 RepID=A0AAU8B9W5_9CAUD